jgi:hypothetical protein
MAEFQEPIIHTAKDAVRSMFQSSNVDEVSLTLYTAFFKQCTNISRIRSIAINGQDGNTKEAYIPLPFIAAIFCP